MLKKGVVLFLIKELETLRTVSYLFAKLILTSTFLVLLCIDPCFSQSYYVDSRNGSDSSNGTSDAIPWRTITKVNATTFLPGDSILFKRGETWNGSLRPSSSGRSGNPITIAAYGSGNLPRITNYSTISSWSGPVGGVYYTHTTNAYGLFEDANLLTKKRSMPISPGEWWQDLATLYYYPSSGVPGDHTIKKVTDGQYAIKINNHDYIHVENLHLQYSGWGIAVFGSADHIYVDSCEIDHCWRHGIDFYKSDGYGSVTNCIMSYFGDSAVYLSEAPGDYYLVANNTMSYCNYGEWDPTKDGHAVGMQSVSYCIVRDNIISYTGKAAISIGGGYPVIAEHNVIKGNTISDCDRNYSDRSAGQGLGMHGNNDNDQANYNIIYQNIFDNCKTGFKPQGNNKGNKFFNNTLYACGSSYGYSAAVFMKKSDNYELKNNIITASDTRQIFQESNVGTNNVFDHNLYYCPDIANGWIYRGAANTSLAAWRAANQTSNDPHSMIPQKPLLADPAGDDFSLQKKSPCIDAGAWLTTIESPTGNDQTAFTVNDATYFYNGFNIDESGNFIRTEGGKTAKVMAVDYIKNILRVDPPIDIKNGEGVALDYKGKSPDIGAKESGSVSTPNQLIIVRRY